MAISGESLDRTEKQVTLAGVPLEQAGAVLTIDLDAVRENYRRLKARLDSVSCAAVVKADAYGLGAKEIACALTAEGCDTFFVAHLAEGIALRQALTPPIHIFVLHGAPFGTEDECVRHDLIPVLNSIGQVEAWRQTAARYGRKLPAALQVDSGMSRMGLPPAEAEALAGDGLPELDVRLVMSHLACADEPFHPANEAQQRLFSLFRQRFPSPAASLSNSSGIFLGRPYHFDLARPGAALYGVNPNPGSPNPMQPVVSLAARVIQLRELPAGSGIGYGHIFSASGPMRVATIALGYADGWSRSALGAAFFQGVRLPFVGRVSMDSTVIDISALEAGALREGDFVEILNEAQTVDSVAKLSGTIGYEVLTSLGKRFHRRYVGSEER